MRLPAFIVGLLFAAVFLGAGSHPLVHAESQNQQPQIAQATPPVQALSAPKVVEVQSGDYLAKIADDNQTTYVRLFDANESIKDPNVIYPGDQLRIPKQDEQLPSRNAIVTETPAPVKAVQSRVGQTPVTAAPRPTPPLPPASSVVDGSVWDRIAQCESGGNWSISTGNGFYGGLQFTLSSWHGVGGSGYPNQASREEQIYRGTLLQARQGWGAWPGCTAKLGIR